MLACEPTLESTLAATGITYLAHAREGQVRLAPRRNLQTRIGEEVVRLPDARQDEIVDFAERVLAGFARHVAPACRHRGRDGSCSPTCGTACARRLLLASASDDPSMPEVMHQYLRLGFAQGPRLRHMIADPRVAAFDSLVRYVVGECEHVRQFARFSHMSDDSYVASFSPRANVVPLMGHHFATRMGTERFCLVDPAHGVAVLHDRGDRHCAVVHLETALAHELAGRRDLADDEAYVRAMWQRFYRRTTMPGREREQRGYDLRTNWMPQRLWDGLLELDPLEACTNLPAHAPERYAGSLDKD